MGRLKLCSLLAMLACYSLGQETMEYEILSSELSLISEDYPMIISVGYADISAPILKFSMAGQDSRALPQFLTQDGARFVFRSDKFGTDASTFTSVDFTTSGDLSTADGFQTESNSTPSSKSSSEDSSRFTLPNSSSTTSPASRMGMNVGLLLCGLLSSLLFQQHRKIFMIIIIFYIICHSLAQTQEENVYYIMIQIPFNSEPFASIVIEGEGGSFTSAVSLSSSGSYSVDLCSTEEPSSIELENFDGKSADLCAGTISLRGLFSDDFQGSLKATDLLTLESTNQYSGQIKIESGSYDMIQGDHCEILEDNIIDCGDGSGLITIISQDASLLLHTLSSNPDLGSPIPVPSPSSSTNLSSIPSPGVSASSIIASSSSVSSASSAGSVTSVVDVSSISIAANASPSTSTSTAASVSPSTSVSAGDANTSSVVASPSRSVSIAASISPSTSTSTTANASSGASVSVGANPSASISSSPSVSPIASVSLSSSASFSEDPSLDASMSTSETSSATTSRSPTSSVSPSATISKTSSATTSASPTSSVSPSTIATATTSETPTITPSSAASESSSVSKTPSVFRTSSPGEFLQIVKTDIQRITNGENPVVGRSYNGYPWEPKPDEDNVSIQFDCSSGIDCSILTDGTYELQVVTVPEELINPDPDAQWVRLMLQGTFGASKSDIDDVIATYDNDYLQWILDQMNIEATSHRSYYRKRTNPRRQTGTTAGVLFQPCEVGSRYHRNAFNPLDNVSTLSVHDGEVTGKLTLKINNELRTEVDYGVLPDATTPYPVEYTICSVIDAVNGSIWLDDGSEECNIEFLNPAISFTTPGSNTKSLALGEASFSGVENIVDAIILDSISTPCENAIGEKLPSVNSFILYENEYFRFDPRIKLLRNSLEEPVSIAAEGGLACPAVAKSFVNAEFCVQSPTCSPLVFNDALLELNEENLRAWYIDDLLYIYEIKDLRLEVPYLLSPCDGVSRWLRLGNGACSSPTTFADATTLQTFVNALSSSLDTNPYVRDITLQGTDCIADASTIGAQVFDGTECFQHVHPDLMNVYDFSLWVVIHDGNQSAFEGGRPNPIAKQAEEGNTYLEYPSWHSMDRWELKKENFVYVGRFGDSIPFNTLPTTLQTQSMGERVQAIFQRSDEGFEACGSPYEYENDPHLGDFYHFVDETPFLLRCALLDNPAALDQNGKNQIWFNINLKANDLLRQRVAWAISQIIPVSAEGLANAQYTESWTNYYDIFVRNAFGNYRDILKEIAYNPLMTQYLSSIWNKAYFVDGSYPDENFAREIMQLFSVGLWKLNQDGSPILDDQGNPIPTYSNDDILDFARLWTGFAILPSRGNMEEFATYINGVDPVYIIQSWRDLLPKGNLELGFLGDRYPICHHLPERAWLKIGARYTFTGDASIEGEEMDMQDLEGAGYVGRYTPTTTSSLYHLLCAPDFSGACTFPTEVTLTENETCEGIECDLATITTVAIVDEVLDVTKYYTYTSIPCVSLEFFENGTPQALNYEMGQCADPTQAVGGPTCCREDALMFPVGEIGRDVCLITKEFMDFDTAASRCANAGLVMCESSWGGNWDYTCAPSQFLWLNSTVECNVKIQVYPTGQIGVVDFLAENITYPSFRTVYETSGNLFRVHWDNNAFPSSPGCPTGCSMIPTLLGDSCLCDTTVTNTAGFTEVSNLPSQEQILSTLFQGAVHPSQYERVSYSLCTSCNTPDGYNIWTTAPELLNEDTIFEIEPLLAGGPILYLINRISIVSTEDSFSFRNPPRFMAGPGELQFNWLPWNPTNYEIPKAEREIDALLDHLFEHPNTAPFIAFRLIQRLVTSNPSPRYIKVVVDAFRSGVYEGHVFSGKYGDLAAAVTAVLLDREARTAMIEVDPTFGVLKEPLVRVIQVFRAMELTSIQSTKEFSITRELEDIIGMKPYESPSVFGFYLPEYRPEGPVNDLGLVSPESQLTISPFLFGMMNHLMELIDVGYAPNAFRDWGWPDYYSFDPEGSLAFAPNDPNDAEQVIDELDLLLTGRRISSSYKEHIINAYTSLLANDSAEAALKHAQKLVLLSPEFHTTNANQSPDQEVRELRDPIPSQGRSYKAIVILIEDGAADSFNMIVPHSECGDHDLNAEYHNVREGAAILQDTLLPIPVLPNTQPCDIFGIHPSFDDLKTLYDNEEALFFANIGALVEPITKEDYFSIPMVKELPPSLFAHNIMSRSTQNLHPQNVAATGVLGRAVNVLRKEQAFRSEMYSLLGTVKILDGGNPDFVTTNGISQFEQYEELKEDIEVMSSFLSDSPFAETYLSVLNESLNRTESIGELLESVTLHEEFPSSNYLAGQFKQVAKFIHLRDELETERDVFVVRVAGFDTHATFDLDPLFSGIDEALAVFSEEMRTEGTWDNVAVLSISEFGRTLTSNGAGTDHGWGGNHFLVGGQVNGGTFLGQYPDKLTEDGDVHIGRGRLLPTTSWEAVYSGLLEWFGVDEAYMDDILPNRANFPAADLFTENDLFNSA